MQATKEANPTTEIMPARVERGRWLMLAAAFLGLLCAGAAFLALVEHDRNDARIMVHDQAAPAAIKAPGPTATLPAPAKIAAPENKPAVAQHPFRLERGSTPAELGPLRVRLTRTDTRRGSYDISVLSGRRSFSHRHLRSGAPVWIALGRGKGALEIVATSVEPKAIAGYWAQSESAPEISAAKKRKR